MKKNENERDFILIDRFRFLSSFHKTQISWIFTFYTLLRVITFPTLPPGL